MQTTPLSKTFEHTLTPELAAEIAAERKAEEDETIEEDTPEEEAEEEVREGQPLKSFRPRHSNRWVKALLVLILTIATFVFCGDWFVPYLGLPGWPVIFAICAVPWVLLAYKNRYHKKVI